MGKIQWGIQVVLKISMRAEGRMCISSGSGERGTTESIRPITAFLAVEPKGLLKHNSFFGSAAGLAWSQLENIGMDLMILSLEEMILKISQGMITVQGHYFVINFT